MSERDDLDRRLGDLVDRLDPPPPPPPDRLVTRSPRPWAARVLAVAAAVIVLVGVAVALGPSNDDAEVDVGTAPEQTEPDGRVEHEVAAEIAPDATAVELVDLPDDLAPRIAEERSGEHQLERQITYNDAPGDLFNWSVRVSASDPAAISLDQIVANGSEMIHPPVETQVRGHRALLVTLYGDGEIYGYQLVWDERPDLRITIDDSRYSDAGEPTATPESVEQLTTHLRGLTEQDWQELTAELSIESQLTEPVNTANDLSRFCAAIDALDQTDGSTEDSVALAAIEDVRTTAPAEIRDDVNLIADTLIVNDFPNTADPSMRAAPYDEFNAARARFAAYIETNCELGS